MLCWLRRRTDAINNRSAIAGPTLPLDAVLPAAPLFQCLICSFSLFLIASPGQGGASPPLDLTQLSLEELMNIEVTLVSRKPEKLAETAAAVFVLTAEDLRRSGVRSIPEALRLVPGMQVGRIDANKWVVTSRGFPGLFANKLLVLIDGRSVYTPLFSGVFWEAQDVVLEDVERIEVIRGPGGTLWGANAVNGVINILTRKAADTPGRSVQVGGGTEERGFATLRGGGRLGEGAHYRAYGKVFTRDRSRGATGQRPADGWHLYRIGGRIDWELSSRDALSVLGNGYRGEVGQSLLLTTSPSPPYVQAVHSEARIHGAAVLGRWERRISDRTDLALQLYYDRSGRRDYVLAGVIHNLDLDFQHRFRPGPRQEIVWGWGYRFTTDHFDPTFTMALHPESRKVHLLSGFVQDDITLVPERLRLIAGTKFEHNSYTGIEAQPNVRFWWSPAPRQALWGAVSRAVRTPSRGDNDIRAMAQAIPPDSLFPGVPSPVALVALVGNRDFTSENLLAFDLGYRAHFNERLTLDLAGFYNLYDDLRTNELEIDSRVLEGDPLPPHLLIPMRVDNKATGKTWGFELAANGQWHPWRLRAGYSFLRMDLEVDEDSFDAQTESYARELPRHQLSVRSYLDLPAGLELDVVGRYVHDFPVAEWKIDRYLTFDLRLGWRPEERLELSLAAQNLLDSPHPEYVSQASGTFATEVEAGVYGVLNWAF